MNVEIVILMTYVTMLAVLGATNSLLQRINFGDGFNFGNQSSISQRINTSIKALSKGGVFLVLLLIASFLFDSSNAWTHIFAILSVVFRLFFSLMNIFEIGSYAEVFWKMGNLSIVALAISLGFSFMN